jgi:hypothetical protein
MRTFAAAALVVALVGAPTAGLAASQTRYTPTDPSAPTLAGSSVVMECRSGDPWIDYRVQLVDPEGQTAAADAVLVIQREGRSTTVPLGTLTGGAVSGSIPWPYPPEEGTSASAVVRAVPSHALPLRMPLAAQDCDSAAGVLAVTGIGGWAPMLGAAGVALVAAGAVLAIRLRRRAG